MARATLDHIVILVSHQTLLSLPEKLAPYLTVSEGGRHADGLTWNHLILFEDGVYIELIAFFDDVDDEKRQQSRWGRLPEGTIIDWACSLPEESQFGDVQKRVAETRSGFGFTNPAPGGRVTPDGTVLKWAIGAPVGASGEGTYPGILPFWCLDRTPRRLRVPYEGNVEATTHPCGAQGVSRLVITVPDQQVDALREVYSAIDPPAGRLESGVDWKFAVPSGSWAGRHSLVLQSGNAVEIKLAVAGRSGSPSFIELLPGLVIKIDST